jgi:hypothetical protein
MSDLAYTLLGRVCLGIGEKSSLLLASMTFSYDDGIEIVKKSMDLRKPITEHNLVSVDMYIDPNKVNLLESKSFPLRDISHVHTMNIDPDRNFYRFCQKINSEEIFDIKYLKKLERTLGNNVHYPAESVSLQIKTIGPGDISPLCRLFIIARPETIYTTLWAPVDMLFRVD